MMLSLRLIFILFLQVSLAASATPGFGELVQPFLAKYCYTCHNDTLQSGGLDFQGYTSADSVDRNRERWEKVLGRLRAHEMPPPGMPQPDASRLKAVTDWIQTTLNRAAKPVELNPGRVTARRLNRSEYNNTVCDLLGVNFHPADDFPQDDSGYGFDNNGAVLSLSPVLMEKYLSAAERIVSTALHGPGSITPTVVRHQPPYRPGTDGGDNSRFASKLSFDIRNYDVTGLALPSALHTMHHFPAAGDYIFRIDPEGNRPMPSDPFTVAVWIDGKQVASVPFEASNAATSLEGQDQMVHVHAPAGDHWVAASALKLYEGLPAKYGGLNPTTRPAPPSRQVGAILAPKPGATPAEVAALEQRRARAAEQQKQRSSKPPLITDVSFRVNFVEITGPFQAETQPSALSRKLIFTCSRQTPACGRKIIADFARRAWRRPVTAEEVTRLAGLVEADRERGDSFEDAVGVGLEAVLVSPQFLFRIERDPRPRLKAREADLSHSVSGLELASRISYFLWSSMPDDELMRAAVNGTLRRPGVLAAQVTRMLQDPKAHSLVTDFGGQWLEFRGLESVRPDVNRFSRFDDYLRMSMRTETEMFFEHIMRENRSVLDFLNGKYTYLNEALARFYGISGVSGPEFRRVDLIGIPRAGVLTQGSVLAVSSYSTRTSVVLRGKWILENLLNAPVPPPPPDVPPLDEAAVGTAMSLRQQMEKHRANAICASCHSRMDPLGFALENFDAIGEWRTEDGKFPVDASGVMPDGRTFSGPVELTQILSEKRADFARAITEKMLTYALGRGLETYDEPQVKVIANQLAKDGYRFSSLVLGIINSIPFQQRKGDRANVSHP